MGHKQSECGANFRAVERESEGSGEGDEKMWCSVEIRNVWELCSVEARKGLYAVEVKSKLKALELDQQSDHGV